MKKEREETDVRRESEKEGKRVRQIGVDIIHIEIGGTIR